MCVCECVGLSSMTGMMLSSASDRRLPEAILRCGGGGFCADKKRSRWSIEWRWISGSGEECRLNGAEVWERGAGLSSHTFHTGEGLL